MKSDVVSGLVSLTATVALHVTGLSEALAVYAFLALVAAPVIGLCLVAVLSTLPARSISEVA